MTTKTVWLAPFVHPTPALLEQWFEREAAEGWHPKELDDMSGIRLRLTHTRAARMRYVVDPQQRPGDDYRSTYEDAGWEYVGELSSLQVWRRRYKGERPEAFTDASSLGARDRRWARVTGTLGALALVGAAVRLGLGLSDTGESAQDWLVDGGVLALLGIPLVIVTATLVRRSRR